MVSTWRLVMGLELGEAVGTIASIYRGTWYTVDHAYLSTGWVASNTDITQGLPRIQEIFEARNPKGKRLSLKSKGTAIEIEEDAATRTKKVFVNWSNW